MLMINIRAQFSKIHIPHFPTLTQMMCKSGLSHIITMDLHQKEIQGFFDCPVDNLRASPFLLQYIQECVSSTKHNSSLTELNKAYQHIRFRTIETR